MRFLEVPSSLTELSLLWGASSLVGAFFGGLRSLGGGLLWWYPSGGSVLSAFAFAAAGRQPLPLRGSPLGVFVGCIHVTTTTKAFVPVLLSTFRMHGVATGGAGSVFVAPFVRKFAAETNTRL